MQPTSAPLLPTGLRMLPLQKSIAQLASGHKDIMGLFL